VVLDDTSGHPGAFGLPIRAGVVDVVVLAYVLFHLPDPRRAISEARRVLREGGVLGTATWAQEGRSLAGERWDEWLEELGVATVGPTSDHAGLATTADVEALLSRGGFDDVRTWREAVDVTFQRADFWRLRTTHGARAVRIAKLDRGRRDDVLRELRRRFDDLDDLAFHHHGAVVRSVSTRV
jgi:SAM-dependent methyltransferase